MECFQTSREDQYSTSIANASGNKEASNDPGNPSTTDAERVLRVVASEEVQPSPELQETMSSVRAFIDRLHQSHLVEASTTTTSRIAVVVPTLQRESPAPSAASRDPPATGTEEVLHENVEVMMMLREDPPPPEEGEEHLRSLSPEPNEMRAPRPPATVLKPEPLDDPGLLVNIEKSASILPVTSLDDSFFEEKKEESFEDVREVLKWLFGTCATAEDAQNDSLEEFLALVHFSAPILLDVPNEPPTDEQVEMIHQKGKNLGISRQTVDRFLAQSQAMMLNSSHLQTTQRGVDVEESAAVLSSTKVTLDFLRRFERQSIEHVASMRSATGIEVPFDPDIDFHIDSDDECTTTEEERVSEGKAVDMSSTTALQTAAVAGGCLSGKPLAEEITQFWNDFKKQSKTTMEKQHIPVCWEDEASVGSDTDDQTARSRRVSTRKDIWLRRRSMAKWNQGLNWGRPQGFLKSHTQTFVKVEAPKPIDATVCSRSVAEGEVAIEAVMMNMPGTHQWKRHYRRRTRKHTGYSGVHVFSLKAAAAVGGSSEEIDSLPWEFRDVSQRFLYEQSVSFKRNWFGKLVQLPGNDRFKEPVCRPRSMEMPIKMNEWTGDWYEKPWQTIGNVLSGSSSFDRSEELAPECGTFKLVNQRIGESVSLVAPGRASFVRRSRWRKTYVQPLDDTSV